MVTQDYRKWHHPILYQSATIGLFCAIFEIVYTRLPFYSRHYLVSFRYWPKIAISHIPLVHNKRLAKNCKHFCAVFFTIEQLDSLQKCCGKIQPSEYGTEQQCYRQTIPIA